MMMMIGLIKLHLGNTHRYAQDRRTEGEPASLLGFCTVHYFCRGRCKRGDGLPVLVEARFLSSPDCAGFPLEVPVAHVFFQYYPERGKAPVLCYVCV